MFEWDFIMNRKERTNPMETPRNINADKASICKVVFIYQN
jgi:hypothetical protein